MLLQISVTAAAALTAAASLLWPLPPGASAHAQAPAAAERASDALRFARFDRLKGGAVHDLRGEELGTVEDLVVDRSSGDIRFLILDRGSAQGLGATWLALPWSRISPAAPATPAAPESTPTTPPPPLEPGSTPRPVLIADVTPAQLEHMPQFDATDGAAIEFNDWLEAMRSAFDDLDDWSQQDRADPFAELIETSQQVTITGDIVRVRRDRSLEAAEHIVVEIRADAGRFAVALGPAWYVMGRASPPLRGGGISIQGWALVGQREIDAVARTATIGEAQVALRDEDGSARWTRASAAPSSDQSSAAPQRNRLTLASQITGASATANAQDAGEIKRLVIEHSTGLIAFVEVDPDANFLGLAENTQVVPWEVVVGVAPGRVRFDATAAMLAEAPDSPDDDEVAAWFASDANRRRVYEQFDLESDRFANSDRDR